MPISDKTRKLLWARAGSRCAICQRRLIMLGNVEDAASIVGDECHIVSRAPNGPRHDPFYAGDPDDYDNLLLLCKADHKQVDDQTGTYSVEKLKQLKAQHEASVDAALANRFDGTPGPPATQSRGFDNFRTTVWFVPDQSEATLERLQQRLIHDSRLVAYGRIATGFKSRETGRYAAWIQAFLPVSARLLDDLASEAGVAVLDVVHERLPGIYQARITAHAV